MELQEPTLRPEAALSPTCRKASQVCGKKATCVSASTHAEEDAERKTKQLQVNNKAAKESLSSSVISSHNAEKRGGSNEGDGAALMEHDAERAGGHPQNDAEEAECTADSVEGSRTSVVCYREFPTGMVYLYYISCLRYTILVRNPRYCSNIIFLVVFDGTTIKMLTDFTDNKNICYKKQTKELPLLES